MTDGYNATYGADEIDEPIVDVLVGVGAALVGFATLVGLVFLWRWYKKSRP